MNAHILHGKDGRRWLTVEGSGRVVELASVEPPPKKKPAARSPPKPRAKKWDGF